MINNLLLENGDALLLESSDNLLLENSTIVPVQVFNSIQRDVPLGCILHWQFSEPDMPTNPRLYLFRRISSPITDDDINDYFYGLPGNLFPEIWIVYPDINGILPRKRFDRERIGHGCTVYYALILRDMDNGIISSKITNSLTLT